MSKSKKNELDENMFEDLGGDDNAPFPSDEYNSSNFDDYSEKVSAPLSNNSYDYGDNEVDSDNSRWELDPDDVFNRIEHLLRSERISRDGSKWMKVPNVPPLLSERGIFIVMRECNTIINKNSVLGNITRDDLKLLMRRKIRNIKNVLGFYYKEFCIDKYNLDSILNLIEEQVYMFLTRPVDGIERRMRKDKYKVSENISTNDGFFPSLFSKSSRGRGGMNL